MGRGSGDEAAWRGPSASTRAWRPETKGPHGVLSPHLRTPGSPGALGVPPAPSFDTHAPTPQRNTDAETQGPPVGVRPGAEARGVAAPFVDHTLLSEVGGGGERATTDRPRKPSGHRSEGRA